MAAEFPSQDAQGSGSVDPTPAQAAAFAALPVDGPLLMLNLLRFRDVADYTRWPDLDPGQDVTGEAAYRTYAAAALAHVAAVGGHVRLLGTAAASLVGPAGEAWDQVLLVEYPDRDAFLRMVGDSDYLAISRHRSAALADARLVPIITTIS